MYYFGPDGTGAGNGTGIDITPTAAKCEKPEPKDGAEDVARKVVYDWNQTDHNAYSEGVLTDNELASLESRIIAAILADREKQAARPATELRGKIEQLCGRVLGVTPVGTQTYTLAREVLAELEAP